MTITVPLSPEDEAKLTAIAVRRGVSPDTFVREVVKQILERSFLSSNAEARPQDGERQLEELFAAFDSVTTPPDVHAEAFHRENWY